MALSLYFSILTLNMTHLITIKAIKKLKSKESPFEGKKGEIKKLILKEKLMINCK